MEERDKNQAFLQAYDDFADAIFRYCYFRVYDRETAKDLAQETFIKTWDYLVSGQEIKNIRAFLYRVATNLVVDYSRKKKTLSLDNLADKGFEPVAASSGDIVTKAESDLALAALGKMDEEDSQLIIMRYINGLTPKEMAEIFQVSENALSVRLHRAVQRAKELIAPEN